MQLALITNHITAEALVNFSNVLWFLLLFFFQLFVAVELLATHCVHHIVPSNMLRDAEGFQNAAV